jgi:hypothetical protein
VKGAFVSASREVLAEAAVTAWAGAAIPLAQIDSLRAQPGPVHGKPLGPKTLRFADELTIAAMAAMLHAIHDFAMHEQSFADWGVIAAPRFAGRMITAANIARQASDPHFSISPHIIPNHCLHSVSGAASVAFGIHGPNFGVGGGPGAVPEALATALSVLAEGRLPGIWVILSEFDPEPLPDREGRATNPVTAHAAAVGIQPAGTAAQLRLTRAANPPGPGSVRDLGGFLSNRSDQQRHWQCGLDGLGSIDLMIFKPLAKAM